MTAETSRIRKIGRSYYVKISNQFEELNLDVGDEVQVIVTSVNHVKLANAASDDDSPAIDIDSTVQMFKSTIYWLTCNKSVEDTRSALKKWGGEYYSDEQLEQVLNSLKARRDVR